MDTLLIPCFDRPELLWHCLDNLSKTGDLGTVHTIFRPDVGHSPQILHVIYEYRSKLGTYEVQHASKPVHRSSKQSKNVLDGWKYGATVSTGLVFMVEEDVMVSRDFFRYHRAIHEQGKVFASLSTKNHNRSATLTEDPSAYYLSTGDYCSLGVCMRKEIIQEHIVPHMSTMYFRDMIRYCLAHFPDSPLEMSQSEQDGLIRRIQMTTGLPTAYPHVPRAFHAGFYGYNRPNNKSRPMGEFPSKVRAIENTIYHSGAMQAAALTPAYFYDSQPVQLDIAQWSQLRQQQPPELAE